jgi:hypothetical protein
MTLRTFVEWIPLENPAGPGLAPGSSPLLRLAVVVSWSRGEVRLTSLQARLLEPGG